jgi:hypothetical protein
MCYNKYVHSTDNFKQESSFCFSHILLCVNILSYHICKFKILVEYYFFLNFNCKLLYFSAQASMEIDKYNTFYSF